MTKTPARQSSSRKAETGSGKKPWLGSHLDGVGYVSGGGPIPDEHFEDDHGSRPMPLDSEGRRKFDAETERLKQFKK